MARHSRVTLYEGEIVQKGQVSALIRWSLADGREEEAWCEVFTGWFKSKKEALEHLVAVKASQVQDARRVLFSLEGALQVATDALREVNG